MSFAQGLSAAGYAVGDLYGKQALAEAQSEQEIQRQMRLAEFTARMKTKMANDEREAQAKRIDEKAAGLADAEINEKRATIEGGIADRSAWTAEHQAAVDQSLAIDRKKLVDDPKTRTKAAIATGDIDPKDAAMLSQKDDAAVYKMLWEQTKLDQQEKIATMREDRRDERFLEGQDRSDARQQKQIAAMFDRLDKSNAKKDGEKDKENTLQSTQVDGNGYLIGVFRNGTTKRMTDPETGAPITSQSFEQRVDRVANSLRKEGASQYRKMPEEDLRAHVRRTLISADSGKPAAAPKPGAPAAAPDPNDPLGLFTKKPKK